MFRKMKKHIYFQIQAAVIKVCQCIPVETYLYFKQSVYKCKQAVERNKEWQGQGVFSFWLFHGCKQGYLFGVGKRSNFKNT